jgi:hypothetical protein
VDPEIPPPLSDDRTLQYCSGDICLHGTGLEAERADASPTAKQFAITLMWSLQMEIATWTSNAALYAMQFREDIARSVVPPMSSDRVKVRAVKGGSTVVTFDILPGKSTKSTSANGNAPVSSQVVLTPTAAALQLLRDLNYTRSALYRPSSLTRLSTPNQAVAFQATQVGECPDGSWTMQCLSQPLKVFDDDDSGLISLKITLALVITLGGLLLLMGAGIFIHLRRRRAKTVPMLDQAGSILVMPKHSLTLAPTSDQHPTALRAVVKEMHDGGWDESLSPSNYTASSSSALSEFVADPAAFAGVASVSANGSDNSEGEASTSSQWSSIVLPKHSKRHHSLDSCGAFMEPSSQNLSSGEITPCGGPDERVGYHHTRGVGSVDLQMDSECGKTGWAPIGPSHSRLPSTSGTAAMVNEIEQHTAALVAQQRRAVADLFLRKADASQVSTDATSTPEFIHAEDAVEETNPASVHASPLAPKVAQLKPSPSSPPTLNLKTVTRAAPGPAIILVPRFLHAGMVLNGGVAAPPVLSPRCPAVILSPTHGAGHSPPSKLRAPQYVSAAPSFQDVSGSASSVSNLPISTPIIKKRSSPRLLSPLKLPPF